MAAILLFRQWRHVTRRRGVTRLATHLSRSRDGREFYINVAVGAQFVFGTLPVDGGDFTGLRMPMVCMRGRSGAMTRGVRMCRRANLVGLTLA